MSDSTIYFYEPPMPFVIRMAGQMVAMAHATAAVMFIIFVWLIPYYAIKAPARIVPMPVSSRRTRRASVDTTISTSSTLVESEFESPKVKFTQIAPKDREAKKLHKKRSQVFNKISSSVAPVARRVAVPAKKVATKISPRNMVISAHAKCNSIISGVHDHNPLPHVKRAYTMHISHPDSTFASSCTAVKKLAKESTRWHRPKKQVTI